MNNYSASIDPKEIEKFSSIASEWWDPNGKFKPLHAINPVRIKYIIDNIGKEIKDLQILDIGCGGGLLSEPFARLGAKVTSIDASRRNIDIASVHAQGMELEIDYRCMTIEELAEEKLKFDVIFNMEVVEHVNDLDVFFEKSTSLLKEGGTMFISTINKTLKAYLFAIIAAEYILKWLPKKTHEYKKFLTPSDIAKYLRKNNLDIKKINGISYNLFKDSWHISTDIDVNYILVARN